MKYFLLNLFGYKYILNLGSKEIHRIKSKHYQCHIKKIKHYTYLTTKQMEKAMLAINTDGCRYCMPEYDSYMKGKL